VTYHGNFYTKSDGSIGGTVTGMDIGTNDGYFDTFLSGINTSVDQMVAVEGDVQAARNLEASFFSGDDRLIGSADGGSVAARMLDGNDSVVLYGGNENDVNGNRGEDRFSLFGGGGRVRGGSDSDVIDVIGGEWRVVNGNKGNDIVTGNAAGVTYRGGADNDILAVSAGTVWGDKGADTFRGVAGDGFVTVEDYTPGEDMVQFGMAGSWSQFGNGQMFTSTDGDQLMLLAGIASADQITLV